MSTQLGVWDCPNFDPGVPNKSQNGPPFWPRTPAPGAPLKGQIDKNLTLNFLVVRNVWLAWNVQKRIYCPLQSHNWDRNAKRIQRVSGLLDTFLAPGLSGHLNNFCVNSPHSRVLLVVLSQYLLSQHLILIQPF